MKTEHAISEEVCYILSQQLCVVEHSEKLVKVLADHDEIKRWLELKVDDEALEATNVWKDYLLNVLTQLTQMATHKLNFFGTIRFYAEAARISKAFIDDSLNVSINLLRKLVHWYLSFLADKNKGNGSVLD